MDSYIEIAIKEAQKGINKNHGGPFGSVIVKNGTIIAKGHNKVLKNNDPTCHGEIVAIRNACKKLKTYNLSECILYTTCEPCPMCLSAIIWSNIKEVYFGCTKEDATKIGFKDSQIYEYLKNKNKELIQLNHIDNKECKELFNKYNGKIY